MKKQKQLPQTITIKRDETQPENLELVAKAIIDLAEAFRRAEKILTRRALVVLLHDMTKVGIPAIRDILIAAPKIADTYLVRK